MTDIIIYTKDWCSYCHGAKQLLTKLGLNFEEIDVTHDQAQFATMVKQAAGRSTVPQILIDGVGIGGYTELVQLVRNNTFPVKPAAVG
jgi:glutaredoxin 3